MQTSPPAGLTPLPKAKRKVALGREDVDAIVVLVGYVDVAGRSEVDAEGLIHTAGFFRADPFHAAARRRAGIAHTRSDAFAEGEEEGALGGEDVDAVVAGVGDVDGSVGRERDAPGRLGLSRGGPLQAEARDRAEGRCVDRAHEGRRRHSNNGKERRHGTSRLDLLLSKAFLKVRVFARRATRCRRSAVKVTCALTFARPVFASLLLALPVSLIGSLTLPADFATARTRWTPRPARTRPPDPGTVTASVAVPFLLFSSSLPNMNRFEGFGLGLGPGAGVHGAGGVPGSPKRSIPAGLEMET